MPSLQHEKYQDVVGNIWGEDWDSTLRPVALGSDGNCGLKMKLKIHFRPIDMRNGPQAGWYQENDDRWNAWHWDRFAWNAWQILLKHQIEQFWENKFWLIPPEDYNIMDSNMGIRPNLTCELEIRLTDTPGGAHHVFNIMAQGEHRHLREMSGGPGFTGWLSDVERGSTPDSATKIVHIRDVGHLLAMPLSGKDNVGFNRYYRFQMPIMSSIPIFHEEHAAQVKVEDKGTMHKVQIVHALPWMKAAQKHTGVNYDRWKVSTRRVDAQKAPKKKKKEGEEKEGGH